MLEMVDDRFELRRLAALRNQDCNVAFSCHSKIAVDRLGKVKENGGRTGRCKCRSNLARNMAGFAEPADDELAWASNDQVNRLFKGVPQIMGKRIERPGLVVKNGPPELQEANRGAMICSHLRPLASNHAHV